MKPVDTFIRQNGKCFFRASKRIEELGRPPYRSNRQIYDNDYPSNWAFYQIGIKQYKPLTV